MGVDPLVSGRAVIGLFYCFSDLVTVRKRMRKVNAEDKFELDCPLCFFGALESEVQGVLFTSRLISCEEAYKSNQGRRYWFKDG